MNAVTDYFAELYVAGRFADAGWNVYFPHRDKGFDFIASKEMANGEYFIRPVQVKGKYPSAEKSNKVVYGYVGRLSTLHHDMVLAIPYFARGETEKPACIAYMPRPLIREHQRGFRCEPAVFRDGVPIPRRDFARYFDAAGLGLVETADWSGASP